MLTYLALGSNLGDKEDNLKQATLLISNKAGSIVRESSLFRSEPWGFASANSFVNQVIAVDTLLSPLDLLHTLQEIEKAMGRTEKSVNRVYHDRIIDIDILLYEGIEITTEELTIPHPLMQERDFVMVPLNEILEK